MAKPTDFLLNTDYEMDKIVYFKSGSCLPGGTPTSYQEQYIDEFDLGFVPLISTVFSFSEDFSDTRMDYMLTYNDSCVISVDARMDGIALRYANTDLNQRLYYRIYGFEPSNSTASVGKTQKDAKQFMLNTDYNYCKLYQKGIVTEDTTITHNLGYTPFVLAWQESPWTNPSPSVISPLWGSGLVDIGIPEISTNDTTVKISGVSPNDKIHYRIYYEEI